MSGTASALRRALAPLLLLKKLARIADSDDPGEPDAAGGDPSALTPGLNVSLPLTRSLPG